ncbi:transposase [Bradyrhizobium sp. USDA 3311]
MPNKSPRVFSREFKLEAVRRILAGEPIRALSQEVNLLPKDLYGWRDLFRAGGAQALRPTNRQPKSDAVASSVKERARDVAAAAPGAERIAELERKIGQQLNWFFRQALRRVKEARQQNTGPSVTGSTRSSRR